MRQYFFTLFLVGVFGLFSFAQTQIPIDLTNFNIEQGLSNYRVHSIHKGKNGFTWIGTDNGLNRFDGTQFKLYQNIPSDSTSISKGNILDIDQDEDGIIWFVTDGGGLNRFNPITEEVTRFFDKEEHRQLRWSYMKDLIVDKETLWIASWGGLIRFNRKSYQTRVFTWQSTLGKMQNEDVKSMSLDQNGLLWLGTTYGVSVIDTKTLRFIDFPVVEEYNTKHHLDVRTLYLDSSNKLWIGKIGFLLCLDLVQNTIKYYSLSEDEPTSNIINCIKEDQDKNLWIATENGIFISNQKTTEGVSSFSKPNFPSVTIYSIMFDNAMNAWLGTGSEGFYINNCRPKKINLIAVDPKGKTGKEIRSIIRLNDDEILFSTYRQGIVRYNTKTHESMRFLEKTYLKNCKITALLLDGDNLWFGTIYNGLFVYNLATHQLTEVAKNEAIVSMTKTTNSVVVATGSGLRIHNRISFKKEDFPEGHQIPKRFFYDYIEFVYTDKSGAVWVSSSNNGLAQFESGFKLKALLNAKDDELIEPFSYISIFEDENDFYLGTNSGLVKKYNGKEVTDYFQPNRKVEITGIVKDQGNNFWISSTNGIYVRHDENTEAYNYFGKQEGLNSYQFYHQSVYQSPMGVLYFGGANGVNYFDPKDVVYPQKKKQTIVNELLVFNKILPLDTIAPLKKKVQLDYNQNFVTFNFVNLGFEKKANSFFKYRLKGLSEQWVTVHNQNAVTYTNLPPGEYEFQVQSANNYGVWDSIPAQLSLMISPPFWMTWWFYLLVFVLTVSIVTILFRNRVQKEVVQKELALFKLQALRSQMNPHFIFNSLNSIQHFIIKNESRFALDYLNKFSSLVRKILDNSIENKNSLSSEIDFLKEYVEIESLRFSKQIEFKINLPDNIEIELIEIPSMLIQPYVENAIIHGLMNKTDDPNCKLEIDFKVEGNYLKCEITDNGIGRKAAMELNKKLDNKRKSHGLSITKRRLETLNNQRGSLVVNIHDLENDKGEAQGTKVVLSILIDEI